MLVQLLIQIEKNSELVCAARECFVIAREQERDPMRDDLYAALLAGRGRAAFGRRTPPICAEWVQLWWILTSINNPLLDIHLLRTNWLTGESAARVYLGQRHTKRSAVSLSQQNKMHCARCVWNMKESRGACAHFDFKTVRGQDERHSQQPRGTWPLLALMKLDENEFFVPLSSCAIWRFWINQMCVIKKSLMWKFLAYRSGLGKHLMQ
jgi:hypothetical protein